MKTGPIITHCICLLAGIGIGLLILRTGKHDSSEVSKLPPPAMRSSRAGQAQADALKRDATRKLMLSIPPHDEYTQRKEWLKNLPAGQFPALADVLCANMGPDGLDYSDKTLLENALKKWLEEDRDAVIEWVNRLPPGAMKRYFLKQLLQGLLETDPERALAMSEAYQADDQEWKHADTKERYITEKIDKAWKKPDVTAEEMLSAYSEIGRSNGTTGNSLKHYPENFDFQKFLDGIVSWNEKDHKVPGTMPTDVLETWARRDPQAAAQWFLATRERSLSVPFQDWDKIAKAVSETNGAESYHKWVADLLSQASDKQFKAVSGNIAPQDALDIANAIRDSKLRDKALEGMAGNAMDYLDRQEQAISLLSEMSTPDAKLAVIEKHSSLFAYWFEQKSLTAAQLQKIGLSEEQVRAVIGKR